MKQAWWRKWHRWIGFVGSLFLDFAAVTGVIVAITEFFGEAEALREATRGMVSPVTTNTPEGWEGPMRQVMASAGRDAAGAPIDKIVLQFKGNQPTVDVFLGKPAGGEDRRLIYDAKTGSLLRTETYADKPLFHRIHSGEFFGDGGLVFAMFWGTALAFLGVSGIIIYFMMRRKNPVGLQKIFW
jgi:uncharacterized iron-regulated membrane protein